MQADDPPCLSVGTAVSAKYKGAFCEAKVSNAVHVVKCKVAFKMGLGTYTINDDHVKGTLRIGQIVQARHPEKREYLEATVMKIQDSSQYTVVFDDGDITTLRRSALCLKSGRHFNESETLDQLPLTHPEHFGNPVVGGRRGRRNRQAKEDSSEEEVEEENELDLGYSVDIGRVVSIETTDKKRSKDNWFPGLVVIPSAQPTVRINVKDEYLVRSFKDGRYYTVPKKEVSGFSRDSYDKIESASLAEAVQKALKYLNNGELPVHWERSTLFNSQSIDSESEDNYTDSCDDEPSEEKDLFVAQLYKFMEDARTPLNTSPTIAKRDVDLHRLYRIVEKLGGYNRVTNQNKWKTVTSRMRLPTTHNIWNQVQSVYKTYLSSFESFYRTLGVTMTVKTRSNKKNRGRSLIRDKDRATPVNSPKPEKEEEPEKEDKIEEKPKRKVDVKKEEDKKKKEVEISDTNSTDTADQSEGASTSDSTPVRSKRSDSKQGKEKKPKAATTEKSKINTEPTEDHSAKSEEKVQQTRSKTQTPRINPKEIAKDIPRDSPKEPLASSDKKKEAKPTGCELQSKTTPVKPSKKPVEDEKRRGRKRTTQEEKTANSESISESTPSIPVNIGDRLIVYYGPNIESKTTYEAKVIDIKDATYLVHYTGWNTRYDEWILQENIAANLSAKNKSSKIIQTVTPTSKATPPKVAGRRGRGTSITGRSSTSEHPRSTTPSSVTSSSSRTKSPATPATRSTGRITRQDSNKRLRRSSAQTEISVQSETDTDDSESEIETIRTRSGSKTESESATPSVRKRILKVNSAKIEKRKFENNEEDPDKLKLKCKGRKSDEEDLEKDEVIERPKRIRQIKKSEDEDTEKEEESEALKIIEVMKQSEDDDTEKEDSQDPLECINDVKQCEEEDVKKEEDDSKLSIKTEKSEDEEIEKDCELEKTKTLKKFKKSPEKIIEDSDEDSTNLPKGRDFDLNQIRLELKGLKVPQLDALEKDVTSSDESVNLPLPEKPSADDDDEEDLEDEDDEKSDIKEESANACVNSDDIYEFKEPEPFEFETRKLAEEKNKKRIPRLFDDIEKSPKKNITKSPRATEEKDSPSADKKRVRKSSKRPDDSDEEIQKKVDAFDKLVESPSYNMGKYFTNPQDPTQPQNAVQQQQAVEKILEEPLFAENVDLYRTERLDLSDNELLFTRGDELFNDPFLKSSPDRNLELDFCKPEEPKNKESDEEDSLRESIQRVIAQTSTDEESNDALRITPPTISYQAKKKDHEMTSSIPSILTFGKPKSEEPKVISLLDVPSVKKETDIADKTRFSPVKQISPALQETDSSLLESIVAQPPLLATCIPGDTKDLNVKTITLTQTGPKIADTILQKLSLMKKEANLESPKHDSDSEDVDIPDIKEEVKSETVKEDVNPKPSFLKQTETKKYSDTEEKPGTKVPVLKSTKKTFAARSPPHTTTAKSPSHTSAARSPSQINKAVKSSSPITVSTTLPKNAKLTSPAISPLQTKLPTPTTLPAKGSKSTANTNFAQDPKKRRKVLSRPYIEDTDSDSSDSEQLVIARSDDDSQTNIVNIKPDNKGSLSNFSLTQEITTDDSQSQEEVRNFKFDEIKKEQDSSNNIEIEETKLSHQETESSKEEEHDLRDLLICEETIPRSPAPSTEGSGSNSDNKTKNKSVLEMPFASAPGSSNNKTILLGNNTEQTTTKPDTTQLMMSPESRSQDREKVDDSSALDNTPPPSPPTPESLMCMSPSRAGGLSPNESLKSNEGESDFSRQRRNSTKISPYSEEDTQMTSDTPSAKKHRENEMPGSCRKRRKSSRCDDIPVKRGRKPMNRSRHNSDSDDTSEELSTNGSTNMNPTTYRRSCQTPRPTKYNFCVEFDSSVDRAERIAIIMQKLTEIRKTYADVKSELAAVERRRKKLRRREREGRKRKVQAEG